MFFWITYSFEFKWMIFFNKNMYTISNTLCKST